MTELYGFNHNRDPVGDYQRDRDRDDALRRRVENGDARLVASRDWLTDYQRTVPRKSSFNWQGRLGNLASTKEINDVEDSFHKAGAAAEENLRQGMGDAAAESQGARGDRTGVSSVGLAADGDALDDGDRRERSAGGELNDPIPF